MAESSSGAQNNGEVIECPRRVGRNGPLTIPNACQLIAKCSSPGDAFDAFDAFDVFDVFACSSFSGRLTVLVAA